MRDLVRAFPATGLLLGGVLFALLFAGCGSYASWDRFVRQPGYALPKKVPLVVSRSERIRAQDDGGFVDTLSLVIQEDLRDEGIEVEILDARGHADPAPRIELLFRDWTEGDRAERYLTYGISGEARITVDCQVITADQRVIFSGTITGHQTDYSFPVREAAERAGHAIAKAVGDPTWAPAPPERGPGDR